MKRNRPRRKAVVKRRLPARPEDLARRYREVCELRRKLAAVSAEAASDRPGKIEG